MSMGFSLGSFCILLGVSLASASTTNIRKVQKTMALVHTFAHAAPGEFPGRLGVVEIEIPNIDLSSDAWSSDLCRNSNFPFSIIENGNERIVEKINPPISAGECSSTELQNQAFNWFKTGCGLGPSWGDKAYRALAVRLFSATLTAALTNTYLYQGPFGQDIGAKKPAKYIIVRSNKQVQTAHFYLMGNMVVGHAIPRPILYSHKLRILSEQDILTASQAETMEGTLTYTIKRTRETTTAGAETKWKEDLIKASKLPSTPPSTPPSGA